MKSSLLEFKKSILLFKYNYLYLKRNFFLKPKNIECVKKFKKNNKVVICGNGPSYLLFENDKLNKKYADYDVVMLNYGALDTKLKINFHIFEMPVALEESIDFINRMKNDNSYVCRIFRPRNTEQLDHINKYNLNNLYVLREKRIRQNDITTLYQDLRQFRSNNVLFCRSSIIYATLFALKLGYNEILYVGINPNMISSWCSNADGNLEFHNSIISKTQIHPTFKKVGGFNSYDILKHITRSKLFENIKFRVDSKSYNFLE